jgi:hypothetical protein
LTTPQVLSQNETFENDSNVIPINGPYPKTDNIGGGDDWLSKLKDGTVFLSKRNNSAQLFLDEWHVANTFNPGYYLLATNLNQEGFAWVPTAEFSRQMELVTVLIQKEEQ